MNDDLVQRLLFAEIDFLDALQNGPQTLASYREVLSALPSALTTARKMGGAGNDTLSLAHSVASRILNLANCFLDIKREEELSTSQLQSDCDAMFHQMGALDLNAQSNFSPFPDSGPLAAKGETSSPVHGPAHQWLLDNLHNPYPTAEVKAQIAVASACQVSSINSWFINARRRIGWTALCRERFSNCRADMIDAAYRALVEENPQCALSPELRHSFVAMKVAAEGMYSSTLAKNAFAGDLEAIVNDTAEEDGEVVDIRKLQVGKVNLTKVAQDPYPSPNPSITASPVPSLVDPSTDESEEEKDIAPPIIAGSKRRRSSIEPVDQLSSTASRPIKRLRVSTTSQAYTCLPSPPSSINGINGSSVHSSPELLPTHSSLPETIKGSLSRKRRVCDADTTCIPKHPNDSLVAPSLYAVSSTLSSSNSHTEYSIDDWFKTNFDDLFAIPPPVDATEPEFSASCEVELFSDYSIPGELKYAPKNSPAPTPVSVLPDSFNPDSLLYSIGGGTPANPSDSEYPSNLTGAIDTASLESSIPFISETNIDWTSLFDGSEVHYPTVPFPQYPANAQPLSEIDLSMLQLPQATPVAQSQSDFTLKQARLHQFHAMQEAVWRMEQELRSEGVVI